MKTIKVTKCSECPFFSFFPGDYFEGSCANRDSENKTNDVRIANRDSIPSWCPL